MTKKPFEKICSVKGCNKRAGVMFFGEYFCEKHSEIASIVRKVVNDVLEKEVVKL